MITDRLQAPGLDRRLEQQRSLAEFGTFALQSRDIDAILAKAVDLAARGVDAPYVKILRHRGRSDDLLLCAGTGWQTGVVGHEILSADAASPAGYAQQSGEIVLTNDLRAETRFRTPDLLARHGIVAALNVPVRCRDLNWGVLEADSPQPDLFSQADADFLLGVANMLGAAIERKAAEDELGRMVEAQRLFAGEMRHRMRNLFTVIYSLVSLSEREARAIDDPIRGFTILRERVQALSRANDVGAVGSGGAGQPTDVVEVARAVLAPYAGRMEIAGAAPPVPSHVAAAIGLLFHEFATNSLKHGALGGENGKVVVSWREAGSAILAVWKETGAPLSALPAAEPGFGSRMIDSVVAQVEGRLERTWTTDGLEMELSIPLDS